MDGPEEVAVPALPDRVREAPVAFVLSGGANLGALQAGMLEALLEAGIVPDMLVGTSIGAVNAAFMAAGPSHERALALSDVWRGLTAEEFFPLSLGLVAGALLRGGVFSAEPLRRLFVRVIPYGTIEEAAVGLRIVATRCERRPGQPAVSLRNVAAMLDGRAWQAGIPLRRAAAKLDKVVETAGIPVRIVATRFERRTEVAFAAGPVVDALMASCALPLVFPPYRIDEEIYVDGGLSEYVPLLPALHAGARTVYVLSLGSAREGPARGPAGLPWARTVFYRSLGNRLWRSAALDLEQVRAAHPGVQVIELPTPAAPVGLRDFSRLGDLIDRAREQTRRFLVEGPSDLGRTA